MQTRLVALPCPQDEALLLILGRHDQARSGGDRMTFWVEGRDVAAGSEDVMCGAGDQFGTKPGSTDDLSGWSVA